MLHDARRTAVTIGAAKHGISLSDRGLVCQETGEGALQEIIADAHTKGLGTIKTINAMEAVLKDLRSAYAELPDPTDQMEELDPVPVGDPDPSNDWPAAAP
jgi:hypothetical protein